MKDYFSPDLQLIELPIFRVAVFMPQFIAAVCILGIWIENYQSMCLQFELGCINNFFATYKIPIGFSSLGAVLGTLIAQVHRSAQTDLVIKESQRKNDFDIREKHEESFTAFVSGIRPEKISDAIFGHFSVETKPTSYVYSFYFPANDLVVASVAPDVKSALEVYSTFLDKTELGLLEIEKINGSYETMLEEVQNSFESTFGVSAMFDKPVFGPAPGGLARNNSVQTGTAQAKYQIASVAELWSFASMVGQIIDTSLSYRQSGNPIACCKDQLVKEQYPHWMRIAQENG